MVASKDVWAIDIGQCMLKALHARIVDDKVEIDNFSVIEHDQILSQPDADEATLIRKSLKKFVDEHDVGNDKIIISVPGHRSFSRFSKLPPVEPKKLPDIIQYEATQQIPFGIDEVVWDYHVFKAEESPDVEVGIFAIKKSIISQYLGYFHELGINPVSVQTAPIALYNACHYEGLIEKSAIVIADVGSQNTNFLIAEDFKLWLRNIPLGGNNFTEALQKSFKLNYDKAENLKKTAATSKYARAVFQSMRPVFSELSSEFQRSIGFYTSINRDAELKQVYALGNAFQLPGLLKFLQQNLGVNVTKLESLSKIQIADNVKEVEFNENILTLTTAYGLALQQLGLAKVNADLMPPEIIKKVLWKKKQYWFIATAASLALAAGSVWMRAVSDSGAIKADQAQNESQIKSTIQKFQKLKQEYQRHTNLESVKSPFVKDIQKITKQRLVLPEIIEHLASAFPKPQDAVAKATTPDQYLKAVKSIERDTRNEIFISKVEFSYVPDLTEDILKKLEASARSSRLKTKTRTPKNKNKGMNMGMGMPGEFGGPGMMPGGFGGPMGQGTMPPDARARGGKKRRSKRSRNKRTKMTTVREKNKQAFVVTISGTTPHKNAPEFLTKTLVKNLQNKGTGYAKKNSLPFWIDRVKLVSSLPVVPPDQRERLNKDKEYTGPTDPLTGEKLETDTNFTVTCVVHLGSPSKKSEDSKKG